MRLIWKRTLNAMMLAALLFAVLGCTETGTTTTTTEEVDPTNNAILPVLSDPDAVFFDGLAYDITYADVYDEMKVNDGINQLLYMVDEDLFSESMAAVTAEEIADKKDYLTYGTTDDAKIAALGEEQADYIAEYDQTIYLMGYEGNEEAYLRLVCAKEAYAYEQMYLAENAEESWYVGDSTIMEYYQEKYFQDLKAIKIRLYSVIDGKNVIRANNLVSYQGQLRLYTGTVPLNNVPDAYLNETNTRLLSNEELLLYFIRMYNDVYGDETDGFRTALSETATPQDLKALEVTTIDHDAINAFQANLTSFLYLTLDSYDDLLAGTATKLCYSYTPISFPGASDTSAYLILKLQDATKTNYSTYNPATDGTAASVIGSELADEIRQILVDANEATSSFVSNRVAEFRKEHGFNINDYFLGLDYASTNSSFTPTETGHASVVAVYDDVEITADEYLAYALHKNPAMYALYAAQLSELMTRYYAEVYCPSNLETCDFDIMVNDSDKKDQHVADKAELVKEFDDSGIAIYGYTWESYLYYAYGVRNDTELMENYYVKSSLQPSLIYDAILSDDWAILEDYFYDQVQEQVDHYFSLFVDTLTIYVDRNEDGTPDDYQDFVSGLEDEVVYATFRGNFETAIRTYLDASSSNSFTTLIAVFNSALRSDAVWGPYKRFGFYLSTESLSAEDEALTYENSVEVYEAAFIDGLAAAYTEYQLPANIDGLTLFYSGNVETAEGVLLLNCRKGSNFTKPTAFFEMTYTGTEPNYTIGSENAGDFPTLAQIKLYCQYEYYAMVFGTDADAETTYGITVPKISSSVAKALETYFGTLHDSLYVIGYFNMIIAENLQTGTFVNGNATYSNILSDEVKADLLKIRQFYVDSLFPGYDPAE